MFKRGILFLIFLFFSAYILQAQKDSTCHCAGMAKAGKGTYFFAFGYNLDWFSKSDIHFKGTTSADYDFTLYNVSAVDKPGLDNLLHEDLTIPQYSFRFGYWFNNKKDFGVELNYDHVKYVVVANQIVHMKGDYLGEYYDKDTMLVSSFIQYEHSNGANYYMANFLKRISFAHSKNERNWLSAVVKTGLGIVVPRSDTWIGSYHRNDTYHVAGIVTGVDLALRYDFAKYFFLETSGKGCYANYFDVLLYGNGKASQHWFSFEYIFTAGIQLPLW